MSDPAPAPSPPPGAIVRCPTCGPIEPKDQKPVEFMTAYVALLKDWRIWVTMFTVLIVVGLIAGAAHLGTGAVGAGGGAMISLILINKVQRSRLCARCGAVAR